MYGNALHKNLCPGGHEIYNFVRPFRGQCNYSLCLNGPCPGVENFLKNTSILHVTPKIPPIRGCVCGRGGGMKFTISGCYIPNLVKIGPEVLEMLTDDAQRWTPTHSNRSPESNIAPAYVRNMYLSIPRQIEKIK